MRRLNTCAFVVLITALRLLSARDAVGQLTTSFEIGFPLTTPTHRSINLLLFGARSASRTPWVVGVDCSIETMPAAVAVGALVFGAGLDVTYPIPVARWAALTPRLGASVLVLGGSVAPGGFAVMTGYNAGVGLMVRTDSKTAVRLDVTRHWFSGNWATSVVTLGIAQMP